jgi:beta-lactamase regulating signal transducer with metallopeptidase domain/peroxiredoxin
LGLWNGEARDEGKAITMITGSVGAPVWTAFGWTMLHFLWIGGLFGVVAGVGRWVLCRCSPHVRYSYALICLMGLTMIPVLVFLQVFSSRAVHGGQVVSPTGLERGFEPTAAASASMAEPLVDGGADVLSEGMFEEDVFNFTLVLQDVASALPWVWLVGAPVTFLWVGMGVASCGRLKRGSRPVDERGVLSVYARAARLMRVSREVGLQVSDRVVSPMLVGMVFPVILLPPAALTGWSTQQLQLVLLHELAHVRRWDNAINFVQRLIESLLFFHPAVWVVSCWVRREREHCCDAVVVQTSGERVSYAKTLASLASAMPWPGRAVATPMAEHSVVGRIRQILQVEDRSMKLPRRMMGSVAAVIVLMVGLVLSYPRAIDARAEEQEGLAEQSDVWTEHATRLAALVGKQAPELREIKDWKNGGPVQLADFKGKVVLLAFWGHWCGPCVEEMPRLIALHDRYAEDGLVIVAVHDDSVASIDEMDTKLEKVKEKYWMGRDLPFLVALDGGGEREVQGSDGVMVRGATTAAYGVSLFPTTVLIGRDGRVVGQFAASDLDDIKHLRTILGAKWRERFDAVYRLEAGQVLKRIAPPFIAERKIFYEEEDSGQAAWIPEPPDYFQFHWDGELKKWGLGFRGGDNPLKSVLAHNLELGYDKFEGPEDVLAVQVPGDWISREDTTVEARMAALEENLREELGRRITFDLRTVERDVVVARGRFEFKPLEGQEDERELHVYSSKMQPQDGGGGGHGTAAKFLADLGEVCLGMQVIDETTKGGEEDRKLSWRWHKSGYVRKLARELERKEELALVLENVQRQSGLSLTVERRPVEVWFVQEEGLD